MILSESGLNSLIAHSLGEGVPGLPGHGLDSRPADMSSIGGDPTYTNLSVAFADATIGDMADDDIAGQLDKACTDGA